MRTIARYMIAFILILLTFHNANANPLSEKASLLEYYGHDHSEAHVNLSGYVIIEQATAPLKSHIDPVIAIQMRYMLGLMRSRSLHAAALYPKWSSTITEITKLPGANGFLVKYNLKTKGIFSNGKVQYSFTLPINPKKLFAVSQGKCSVKPSEESNFWYHWEPTLTNCPLRETVDYFITHSNLTPIKNTEKSYPEYSRLVDASKVIKVTMFFGFEKYGYQNWTPSGTDWGIRGFNQAREFLKNSGFSEAILTAQQVASLYKAKDRFIPYISEFTFKGSTATIRIRLILCDTGINHNSTAFHFLLKDSLQQESVIVYNGHSGIGHNLDLSHIEKLRGIKFVMSPKYQIVFLGSCIPYSYYTEIFFNRKKNQSDPTGSRHLDILSYGKEALFGNKEDQAFIKALTTYAVSGEKQSYQQIINSSPNYFFGVNGDEDNPLP